MKSPGWVARILLDSVATTLFPGDCRVCSEPLCEASNIPVCRACIEAVTNQKGPLCSRCGERLEMDLESVRFSAQRPVPHPPELHCAPCRQVPPAFSRAVAFAEYQGELREMIHLLKYDRMPAIARHLGRMLAEAILTLEASTAADLLVVAVPLYPAKERQRGYNQTTLITAAALNVLRKQRPAWSLQPMPTALRRARDTESQFSLNPRGRRANLRGAFHVPDPGALAGREVLLVDDIYTTGATARECSRVLVQAGARAVWVATLSRAQTETVARWDQVAQWTPKPVSFGAHIQTSSHLETDAPVHPARHSVLQP